MLRQRLRAPRVDPAHARLRAVNAQRRERPLDKLRAVSCRGQAGGWRDVKVIEMVVVALHRERRVLGDDE